MLKKWLKNETKSRMDHFTLKIWSFEMNELNGSHLFSAKCSSLTESKKGCAIAYSTVILFSGLRASNL